ncbi:MAG: hypothetical protein JWM53_236 [bacterium]|nr:hypothetical protein [bacterium]
MNRAKRIFSVAGIALGSWTGVALAQQPQMNQPPPGSAQPQSGTAQPQSGTAQPQAGTDQTPSGTDQTPSGTAQPRTSDSGPAPTKAIGELMHMTATVQKIDTKKHELTLKDDTGSQLMIEVPPDVSRLDQVKKGDRLDIDYYQSVALSLKKPGEAPAPGEAAVVEQKVGTLPGGLVARKIIASAQVMKVDPQNNKVTIKGPAGQVDTINVSDPDVQADLRKLKPGDKIQVTYSEALAAALTPKGK